MTRKRFIKLRMGLSKDSRNEAEYACRQLARTPLMPYEILFRVIYRPYLKIQSKKQARYFGKPQLEVIDIPFIEKLVEVLKEGKLDKILNKNSKDFIVELEEYLLKNFGMWNYQIVAKTAVDILNGKINIEELKESFELQLKEN